MKVAVSIPDEIGRSADRAAKRLGVARSQLYARAVFEYVQRLEAADVTARLTAVYGDEATPRDDAFAAAAARETLRRTRW